MSVHVEHQWYRDRYAVYVYREIEGQCTQYVQPDGSLLSVETGVMNENVKPTIVLDEPTIKQMMEAFQNIGVQPKQITLIEGKYEAQSQHLADLQNMLRCSGRMK